MLVDKIPQRLDGQSVYIHPLPADKAGEFLQPLCRTCRIQAFEGLRAAPAFQYGGIRSADRALIRDGERTFFADHGNTFGDNFVGLDDLETCLPVLSYAESFHLADIAKRCPGNRRSFQFNRFKDRNRRDR